MINIFNSLANAGEIIYSPLNAIRVKVHTSCQWTCRFCHMEGNHFSSLIKNDETFISVLCAFRDRLGFNEVHYTGGEPSIHPQITGLIKAAKSVGLKVKMTTNGQAKIKRYEDFIRAGLEEINVSMHTLNGKRLGEMMFPRRNEDWGKRAVDRQLYLIDSLKNKISVKINTCVGGSESEAVKIARFAFGAMVSWRPMNIIEKPIESYASLYRLCDTLKAKPVSALVVKGSSSFRITMETPNGLKFNVKLIRPSYLHSMCTDCNTNEEAKCYEYAYGPRIEACGDELVVRNCVHCGSKPQVLPVSEFFNHPIASDLYREIYDKK